VQESAQVYENKGTLKLVESWRCALFERVWNRLETKGLRAKGVGKKVTRWNLRILRELEGPPGGRAWCAEPGRIEPAYRRHYSILVSYVKDYFKCFELCGIAHPYLELELEGELDGAGAADLVEGVEAAIGAAGAEAAGQRLRRVDEGCCSACWWGCRS